MSRNGRLQRIPAVAPLTAFSPKYAFIASPANGREGRAKTRWSFHTGWAESALRRIASGRTGFRAIARPGVGAPGAASRAQLAIGLAENGTAAQTTEGIGCSDGCGFRVFS